MFLNTSKLVDLVERDLEGAKILSSNPHVDEEGEIVFSEFIIRLRDGRDLTIEATEEGNMVLRVETNAGWRNFNAEDDYAGELDEVCRWYPDPPEPWDRW